MRRNTSRFTGIVLAVATMAFCAALVWAQQSSPPRGKGRQFMEAAIARVPGFLGMKKATTAEGTEVNLIWFRNKDSVLDWYESDAHQEVMNKYFGDEQLRKPLANIADNAGPLLVIASFTQAKKPRKRLPLFSQFAIEIYQPLEGGLFVGGTVAPEDARVPGLREVRD